MFDAQLQIDPVNAVIAFAALIVSGFVALQVRSLSHHIGTADSAKDVLSAYSAFNQAMLDPAHHKLYWDFMRAEEPFRLDNRVNHILLLYTNAMYAEWIYYHHGLRAVADMAVLERDLCFLVARADYIMQMLRALGIEDGFVAFMDEGFKRCANRPLAGAGLMPNASAPQTMTPSPA